MNILKLHPNLQMPERKTDGAGAYDIVMPESGSANATKAQVYGLGFATEIPTGYVAKIFPRSGVGFKHGLELNNSTAIIDSDYRGEWKVSLRVKSGQPYFWNAGDRILQFTIEPVHTPKLQLVQSLDCTKRGNKGMGSTGVSG